MGDVLWMTGELHGWLAGLCTSDPPLARRTAQAILALLWHGSGLGPPLVVPVPGFASSAAGPRSPAEPDPGPALDDAYQRLLGGLTNVRRRVADVATTRKRVELQIAALPEGDARRAELRDREAELVRTEEKITAESQRMQQRVEAFRHAKEAAKARYTAARAQRTVNEASALLGDAGPEVPFPGADQAASSATAAVAGMLAAARDLERELGPAPKGRRGPGPGGRGGPEVAAPDLMSLRPAAPGCQDIQILFTFGTEGAQEPFAAPGSVLLLAVGARHTTAPDEPGMLITQALGRYWAALAVGRPGEASGQPPRGGWPLANGRPRSQPGTGPRGYDGDSFAREFFPGEADALAGEAAGLAARVRPRSLAELRGRSGLTQAELARRLGVRQERVSAIERGELSAAEVRTLAAYVTALGGRLDIAVDFGTDRLPLR
jgi:DNA-binding XRE family transcriptional regulator